jgi:signal transduction histidine kinase
MTFFEHEQMLSEISAASLALNNALDLDTGLAQGVEAAMRLAGAQAAALWIRDERSVKPRLHIQRGAAGDESQVTLSVPLHAGGQELGALELRRVAQQGAFQPAEQSAALLLAAQMALLLRQARLSAALEGVQQSKSKFVSVVTHELRIPMTSILGYTDLLRQGLVGPVNAQQLGFLNTIRSNVERMSALVSDLADIARIESGRLKLASGVFSVEGVIKDALEGLRARLEEKQQQAALHVAPELPHLHADRARLAQALTNLLSNASKYSPPQGRIYVQARMDGEKLWIGVHDEGIGIAPEDQVNVFDPFFRSEASEVREQQGWGLGLSVARRLVEAMGGEMGMESTLGKGSLFWISLPPAEEQDEKP